MLTVAEAEKIIFSQLPDLGNEIVPFPNLTGRVLAENVVAKRPQPPFDRVTMDGIAIHSDDWDVNDPQFKLQGEQFAGDPAQKLKPGHCLTVTTGAVLPKYADCVIPVEQIEKTGQGFKVLDEFNSTKYINPGRHIHPMGSDQEENDILIPANTKLNATHIACLLSAGHTSALVKKLVKISVLMTGDELVLPSKEVLDHQIYASNGPTLKALLQSHAQQLVLQYLIDDNEKILSNVLNKALAESDIVITTGAVSMGQKDLLPSVFKEMEVECLFHKVKQKPGKPMWFGKKADCLVFALPGNPISAMATARRYVIPAIEKMSGLKRRPHYAKLSEDISFKPELSYFHPVKVLQIDEVRYAEPIRFNTSGDTVSLIRSDGFIELDASVELFNAGDVVRYFAW